MNLIDLVNIAITLNNEDLRGKDRENFLKKNYNMSERTWQKKIKDTPIAYNNKTKQYDIPNIDEIESNYIETPKKLNRNTKETNDGFEGNSKVTKLNSYEIVEVGYKEIAPKEEFNNMKNDIEYIKNQLNVLFDKIRDKEELEKNIIQIPKIDLEQYDLSGEVEGRSFKTYKYVLKQFSEFCSKRNETQKDLLAVALLEFMQKYGR